MRLRQIEIRGMNAVRLDGDSADVGMIVHVEPVVSRKHGRDHCLANLKGIFRWMGRPGIVTSIAVKIVHQAKTKGWVTRLSILDIEDGDGEVAQQTAIDDAADTTATILVDGDNGIGPEKSTH